MSKTYTVYKEIKGTLEGEALASGLNIKDAAKIVGDELETAPDVYVWLEKEFNPSPECFDFDEGMLETERRHAEKEGRPERRIVAIGDETGVTKSVINWSHRPTPAPYSAPTLDQTDLESIVSDNAMMITFR